MPASPKIPDRKLGLFAVPFRFLGLNLLLLLSNRSRFAFFS
jgi:hypothetical protein